MHAYMYLCISISTRIFTYYRFLKVRMTKTPFGSKLCKVSNVPFQGFRWKAGTNGRFKETMVMNCNWIWSVSGSFYSHRSNVLERDHDYYYNYYYNYLLFSHFNMQLYMHTCMCARVCMNVKKCLFMCLIIFQLISLGMYTSGTTSKHLSSMS